METMTTDEHLDLILKRCTELLVIAERRTQGEWTVDAANGVMAESNSWSPVCYPFGDKQTEFNDAQFIASCAGSAEAGWKATIAMAEMLQDLCIIEGRMLNDILAAWPIELLKP